MEKNPNPDKYMMIYGQHQRLKMKEPLILLSDPDWTFFESGPKDEDPYDC